MPTKRRIETVRTIQATLGRSRLSARQVAFVTGISYYGVASCLNGMLGRKEVRATKAQPDKPSVYWNAA